MLSGMSLLESAKLSFGLSRLRCWTISDDAPPAPPLPSVLSGVLLVAVMYRYGTSLAGRGAGLLAAALAATYAPFIFWSRQAWFYATFVLLWVLALYCFDRATTTGSRRALLLGV